MNRDFVLDKLRQPVPAQFGGDHDLNPDTVQIPSAGLRSAAVLIPLVDRPEGLQILLTRRTEHLAHHAGQISFPGGRFELHDADDVACALRETEEEIGLTRQYIEIAGQLDLYITGTGFRITPVVGLVQIGFNLSLDQNEVAEAFEVPLNYFLDPANHQRHSGEFKGHMRHWYAMSYGDYYIWGATAGMLINLYRRLLIP